MSQCIPDDQGKCLICGQRVCSGDELLARLKAAAHEVVPPSTQTWADKIRAKIAKHKTE
jgi:hypothetical protein